MQKSERLCDDTATRKGRDRFIKAVTDRVNDHTPGDPILPEVTLAEYWNKHYLPFITKDLKPSTVHGYKQAFNQHIVERHFGKHPLKGITTPMVTKLLGQLAKDGQVQSSIAHVKWIGNGICKHALATGYPSQNPWPDALCLERATQPKKGEAYSVNEALGIRAAIDRIDAKLAFALACFLGIRKGEIQVLKWKTLLMVRCELSWRAASHEPDMQFLIVQLPNHGAVPDQPTESAWAELREAPLLTVKQLPSTGLAVTIDVGDPKDVHPHRKAEVRNRLALWALGTTYHQSIAYSGPLYESIALEGNAIRIRFANIGSGLEAKGAALRGFAIAGQDRKFHWASARIDGDSIVVSSSEVAAPVAVRYAWGDSPECNLFNVEGLPASPFRTDRRRDLQGDTK